MSTTLALVPISEAAARNMVVVSLDRTAEKHSVTLIDFDTIKQIGSSKTIWTYIYADTRGKKPPLIFTTLLEFDCQQDRRRTLQSTYFDPDFEESRTYKGEDWTYVEPGARDGEIMKRVCSGKYPDTTSVGDVEPFQIMRNVRDMADQ